MIYLTNTKGRLVLESYYKNHQSPFSVKYHYSLVVMKYPWAANGPEK